MGRQGSTHVGTLLQQLRAGQSPGRSCAGPRRREGLCRRGMLGKRLGVGEESFVFFKTLASKILVSVYSAKCGDALGERKAAVSIDLVANVLRGDISVYRICWVIAAFGVFEEFGDECWKADLEVGIG